MKVVKNCFVKLQPIHCAPVQSLLELRSGGQMLPCLGKGEPLALALVPLGPIVILIGDGTLEEVIP